MISSKAASFSVLLVFGFSVDTFYQKIESSRFLAKSMKLLLVKHAQLSRASYWLDLHMAYESHRMALRQWLLGGVSIKIKDSFKRRVIQMKVYCIKYN